MVSSVLSTVAEVSVTAAVVSTTLCFFAEKKSTFTRIITIIAIATGRAIRKMLYKSHSVPGFLFAVLLCLLPAVLPLLLFTELLEPTLFCKRLALSVPAPVLPFPAVLLRTGIPAPSSSSRSSLSISRILEEYPSVVSLGASAP